MKSETEIVQIVPSLREEAAGPSYSVRRLAEALAENGNLAHLVSIGEPGTRRTGPLSERTFAQTGRSVPILHRLRMSKDMRDWLTDSARGDPVFHVHGLWLMPNVYPGLLARSRNLTLIHAPRGMLGPGALKFSSGKKKVFAALIQNRALQAVTCFHATSTKEVEDIRAYGLKAPVALIPNGIDVLDDVPASPVAPGEEPARRTLLYLGRVHPKKGLDRLVAAWSSVEQRFSDWQLRIVGPSEIGYGDQLRKQVHHAGLERVEFNDGLFGDEKVQAYRDADVFVLPTLDENFGMVVAESLANGTPVISTKGAPWEGLVTHGCGWWIDHGVEQLAATLAEAMALPRAELKRMGARGRDWMIRDFSWARIAADMEELYRWCGTKSDPPAFVSLE